MCLNPWRSQTLPISRGWVLTSDEICLHFVTQFDAKTVFCRLKFYECKQNPLACPQHEQWYKLHVWGPLIDKVFLDVEYLDVVRYKVFFLLCLCFCVL
jgi:hypothetical protein